MCNILGFVYENDLVNVVRTELKIADSAPFKLA